MCYKYPGPRCSPHAYKVLVAARTAWESATNDADRHAAMKVMKEAEIQYDMTPKGQELLREQMKTADEAEVALLSARLEYGVSARKAALDEIKAADKGDPRHRLSRSKAAIAARAAAAEAAAAEEGVDQEDDENVESTDATSASAETDSEAQAEVARAIDAAEVADAPERIFYDEERLARNLEAHRARMAEWDEQSAHLAAENDFTDVSASDWHQKKCIVFDLETTGVNPREAKTVTASILEVYGDPYNPDKIVTREWMVNPGEEIPAGAAAVHGVSTERAIEEGIDPKIATEEIVSMLRKEQQAGNVVIGYNVSYDFTLLDAEARRHGVEPLNNDELLIVDPLVIDYANDPYRGGKRTLTVVSDIYGVTLDNAHNSSADCLASAQLAHRMTTTYMPSLRMAPETLMSVQRVWKKRWADNNNERAILRNRTPDFSDWVGIGPLSEDDDEDYDGADEAA